MYKLTYGDLEETLLALGFTVKTTLNDFGHPVKAYEHIESGAWIGLRSAPLDEHLKQIDMMASEKQVVWNGVTNSERFHRLLEKPAVRARARAALSKSEVVDAPDGVTAGPPLQSSAAIAPA